MRVTQGNGLKQEVDLVVSLAERWILQGKNVAVHTTGKQADMAGATKEQLLQTSVASSCAVTAVLKNLRFRRCQRRRITHAPPNAVRCRVFAISKTGIPPPGRYACFAVRLAGQWSHCGLLMIAVFRRRRSFGCAVSTVCRRSAKTHGGFPQGHKKNQF